MADDPRAPDSEHVDAILLSPTFRRRLIAAVERPLAVRRAILLLAGHACGHLPGAGAACRVCRAEWPCQPVSDAARPALDAVAECEMPRADPLRALLADENRTVDLIRRALWGIPDEHVARRDAVRVLAALREVAGL